MAREGVLTALQAALAGLGGGIEGAQQYRELERRRMREQEALNYQRQRDLIQDARQREANAAALRREEREVASTMIPAERFASMTMPGATPMQAALRQTIGGKEYVYAPQITGAEKHRADVMKERGERQKEAKEAEELGGLYEGLEVGGRRIIPQGQGRVLARMPVNAQSSVIGAATRIAEAQLKPTRGGAGVSSLDTGERALLSQAQTNARNSADEFQRTLQSRPQQKDFVNPLTKKPDKVAFAEATQRWAAGDSTFAARRMAADQAELERLKADLGVAAPAAPARMTEEEVSLLAQRRIAKIQDSDHTPEEKQQKIQEVNAILAQEIAKIRGVGR